MATAFLLSKYGLREWLTATIVAAALIALFLWLGWWPAAVVTAILWLAVVLFFRDPIRRLPRDLAAGVMLSPADGVISAVSRVDHHDAAGGPAVVIRIFLSVLNVHVNRFPCDAEVVGIKYTRGSFHDARSARCPVENESNLMTLRLDSGRTIGVRQIAGKLARRIVCGVSTGDRLVRGQRYGMIKFGSSTELILPQDLVAEVHVEVGQRVKGGVTKFATVA
ncbi:MAG: phosphatidylserine decarboxylase family protein [Planctomycetota bacterium]|nr:MAG: phosphatidylserine decarboxylase family protein [Planctomycetota bacterium]